MGRRPWSCRGLVWFHLRRLRAAGGSQGEGTPGLQLPHVSSIDEDSQEGQLSPFASCKQSPSPTFSPSGNPLPWTAAKASFQKLPTWNQGTGPALQPCSSSPLAPLLCHVLFIPCWQQLLQNAFLLL